MSEMILSHSPLARLFPSSKAQQILRGLCDPDLNLNVVGADLMEVSPPDDMGGITALAGANITFELLCVLHESMMRQREK